MPLSEEELRQLAALEQSLSASDPELVRTLRGESRANRAKMAAGVFTLLAGMALVILGVAINLALVGVIGFIAMLYGAYSVHAGATGSIEVKGFANAAPAAPKQPVNRSFMSKVEERWDKRRRESGNGL